MEQKKRHEEGHHRESLHLLSSQRGFAFPSCLPWASLPCRAYSWQDLGMGTI